MIRPLFLCTTLAALVAASAFAQDIQPADTTAAPPAAPATALGSTSPGPTRPHFVIPRAESDIRADRQQMLARANNADSDILEYRKLQIGTRATVEVKRREIELLSARTKAARQAKADAERQSLERERKRQEGIQSYFERVELVYQASIDEAQARKDWAKSAVRACDLEMQLAGHANITANDSDPALFKTEQQYLEAVKDLAQARGKLADKEQVNADHRLKVYTAWADYLAGK